MPDVCSPLKIGGQIYPQELDGITASRGWLLTIKGCAKG